MATIVKDIVTWLKQWYYTESEVDTLIGGLQTQINNKADSTTVSSLSTTVGTKADKTGGVAQITDANAHTNIGTSANATQGAINTAIDSVIGSLSNIRAIQIVSSLPTASADTMGKLYIISENSKINVYYTEQSGSSYSWHKMDADILDELTISWNDIQNKPSTFTPSSHAHGQVTNDGKITSTAVTVASGDNIVITDASDSSIVKRVANLLASHIKDSSAHSNIGSSANATQSTINTAIDTALGNKANSSDLSSKADKTVAVDINSIELADVGETNEGCIIFETIS